MAGLARGHLSVFVSAVHAAGASISASTAQVPPGHLAFLVLPPSLIVDTRA